jgi:hypothetical protein
MSDCSSIRSQFSEYLDGAVSGAAMHAIASHLEVCQGCTSEFAEWRTLQRVMTSIGPAKPPVDLGLRLRVAISQEKARTTRRRIEAWQVYWENTLSPVLVRGAAGLATATVLLGVMALMIGTVAAPPPVAATETAAVSTTSPQFLYTVGGTDSRGSFARPVLVEVAISSTGRVYDYRIVSGPTTKEVRESLDNMLLMSHFTPARVYGIPVPGLAILSFSGPSVRG